MTTTRFFLCALLLSTACISRGAGTDPPAGDASVDTTVTPTDGPVSDIASDRARRDVTCAPTMTREDTPARCNDGLDNDCNGFADCDDFACRTCAVPACLTGGAVTLRDGGTCTCGAPETTMAACSDGLDNDCDGFFDCQDFSCQTCAVPVCLADGGLNRGDAGFCTCRGAENTNATCGDGVDNDCDGFTDCGDFDCTMTAGLTVCARDGGRTDTGPCTMTGAENTNAACSDGIDNDCDGFIDCGGSGTSPDFDCTRTSSVTVCGDAGAPRSDAGASRCDAGGVENSTATCGDGIDNDCDGFTDCADFSCRTCAVPSCAMGGNITLRDGGVCMCRGEENSNAACGDRVDNDCDGFVDCADFDCSMSDAGVTVCPRDGGTD
jgi:Putative metal-binding motif